MQFFYNLEDISNKINFDISNFTYFEKITTLILYNTYHILVLFIIVTIAYKLAYKLKNIIF